MSKKAKTLTAVRIPPEELKTLQSWADQENKNSDGPRWSVSFLVQRAVKELIERNKK